MSGWNGRPSEFDTWWGEALASLALGLFLVCVFLGIAWLVAG